MLFASVKSQRKRIFEGNYTYIYIEEFVPSRSLSKKKNRFRCQKKIVGGYISQQKVARTPFPPPPSLTSRSWKSHFPKRKGLSSNHLLYGAMLIFGAFKHGQGNHLPNRRHPKSRQSTWSLTHDHPMTWNRSMGWCTSVLAKNNKSSAVNPLYPNAPCIHRIVLVLVIGGRDYIIPQKAIYTWYISGIYCQLGDYMIPTTFYKNLKKPLMHGVFAYIYPLNYLNLGRYTSPIKWMG